MSEEHYTNREWLMVQNHAKQVAAIQAENQRLREALIDDLELWESLIINATSPMLKYAASARVKALKELAQ